MKRIVVLGAIIFLVVLAVFFMPKTTPPRLSGKPYQRHYWGIMVPGYDYLIGGWTGASYVWPEYGARWRFEFGREGVNAFKGYYADGTLLEEGLCYVSDSRVGPTPWEDKIDTSTCYRRDGTVGSKVIRGTGVRTIWNLEGVKLWEEEYVDHNRVRSARWFANGQLQQEFHYDVIGWMIGAFVIYNEEGLKVEEGSRDTRGRREGTLKEYYDDGQLKTVKNYVNDKLDGPFILYDEEGRKVEEGSYKDDEKVGRWVEYNEDGSIRSEEKFDR